MFFIHSYSSVCDLPDTVSCHFYYSRKLKIDSRMLSCENPGMNFNKIMRRHGLLIILSALLTGMLIIGVIQNGLFESVKGMLELQLRPARLINDFIADKGVGPALWNAAFVGFIGLALIFIAKIPLSGPTFAAVLTMTGFGLFGKTPFNILPIVAGVVLAAKLVNKSFREYLIIALFGTALGPLVSTIAWEIGLPFVPALLAGTAGGLAAGFFLPPLAFAMLHLHQGYNLYNMGLTCGFFSLFAFALLNGFGHAEGGTLIWYAESNLLLILLIPVLSLILIAGALLTGKTASFKDWLSIQKIPGRLPSDFVDLVSQPGALLNAGVIGLLASLYIWLIGADFNGPVLGGILTIMGFAAFGTHLVNAVPVMAGVAAATLLTGNSLNAPGPVLAILFSTTLGPLSGQFGPHIGFSAGFIHLVLVMQTGAWSGGVNLYNNGFAGGLTAAFFVAVIQWYKTNKEEY